MGIVISLDELPDVGSDPRRVLHLDAVHNFRDLGGYPTEDGRTTKWGVLYRADGLYRLAGHDLEKVRDLGLKKVIDLRTDEELDVRGRFPLEYHPVTFHHLSVMDTTWVELPEVEITDRTPAEFLEWAYLEMLRDAADRFARAIDHLGEDDCLPAVFHCAAGKDRTGVLAMLLLGAMRVRHEFIVADYALTGEGMERMRDWARRESPEILERMAGEPTAFHEAVPEAMAGVISAICQRHGSLRDYVLHLGVPQVALDGLEAGFLA